MIFYFDISSVQNNIRTVNRPLTQTFIEPFNTSVLIYLNRNLCLNPYDKPFENGAWNFMWSTYSLSFGMVEEHHLKSTLSSGILRRIVCWKSADVFEEHTASIFRVKEYETQETKLNHPSVLGVLCDPISHWTFLKTWNQKL
jgi:hypothetical protein